jgi:hypothetical protein
MEDPVAEMLAAHDSLLAQLQHGGGAPMAVRCVFFLDVCGFSRVCVVQSSCVGAFDVHISL